MKIEPAAKGASVHNVPLSLFGKYDSWEKSEQLITDAGACWTNKAAVVAIQTVYNVMQFFASYIHGVAFFAFSCANNANA